MTKLTSAFVDKVNLTADIRYQLVWNFGGYLVQVPRRLGTNPALDAASEALVAAHTSFCSTGPTGTGSGVLVKYSRALKALRKALTDPVTACSTETLGAIMLLMIVQVLTNPTKGFAASHPEGAAQVLKARGLTGRDDRFENILLLALRGPVIFEALWNDKIHFSQHEWKMLVENRLEDGSIDARWLKYLAAVPDLLQRCRSAIQQTSIFPDASMKTLALEADSLLQRCSTNITQLRERLRAFEKDPQPVGMKSILHAQHLRLLSLALFTGIILGCIHRSLTLELLHADSDVAQWSRELFHLANIAVQYRPLGSMAMIICLQVAWIGAADENTREDIRVLLTDYHKTFLGQTSDIELLEELKSTERRFCLRDVPRQSLIL